MICIEFVRSCNLKHSYTTGLQKISVLSNNRTKKLNKLMPN
ncbi:Uncharacterised protein [Mycobacteroides abscessus subsp. abscessus]|nr:Uncharacterised protein [Mycobacteroides abscessus subsp. abscessus]